jgi:hypothetical protein
MFATRFIFFSLVVVLASSLRAQPGNLDFLTGDWEIVDATGKLTATSTVTATVKGSLLSEVRTNAKGEPTAMWWVNSEAAGNWKQLIVGANGLMRETLPLSKRGEWPIILGGKFTNPNGAAASFRLSIARVSDDESKRKLEMSNDDGATWTTIFDQTYRRKSVSPAQRPPQ